MSALARSLTGIESIAVAEKLREERQERRRCDWPYVHLFPPANAIPVNQFTLTPVVSPAVNSTAVVLTYQVPEGYRFMMSGILTAQSGAAFVPGDLLWTVTENKPTGIADVQGAPKQGLTGIPVPLGSWLYGLPWKFERPYEFEPDTVLRSTAKNISSPVGAPNLLVSAFLGFLVPDVEVRR